jgi:PAS domain S-box-containing protein
MAASQSPRQDGKKMQWKIGRRLILWGIVAATTILVFAGWKSYRNTTRLVEAAEARKSSYELVQVLDEVEMRLVDAETGQRGYLLTGDEAYLQPYHTAIKNLDQVMARLKDFSSNNPKQQEQISSLWLLIENKLGELQRTIDLRRREEIAAANQVVLQGSGKRWMDQIRGVITDMKNDGYEVRRIRTQQMNEMAVATERTILIGYFVSLSLLVFVFVLLDRELRERKRAQEAQGKSEKWLATTLGSIGDAVIATDMNGAVTFMNPVAQSLTGWSLVEAQGKSMDLVFDIVNKETRRAVENPVKKVFREGKVVGLADHTLLISKNGKEFEIEDSAAPIVTAAGERLGVVLVFRDITELNQTREELDRYFTLSIELLCIAGTDGYFKRLNPVWEKVLGYSTNELMEKPFLEFIHPDDRQATIQESAKLDKGINTISFENRYRCKDGSYRWFMWSATPLAEKQLIYAMARDVTEVKRAEQALRLSEEQNRLLFESNPHPVWVYDLETLAIIDVNEAAIRNYGYSREEFLTLTIKDIRPAEDVPAVLESVAKSGTMLEENRIWRHRRKNGTLLDVEITSHPLVYAGRNARLVVSTDITKRKQAEEALRQSEERFRLLVSGVKDYAIFMLDVDGRVASWNAGAERFKGYQAQEIIGQSFSRFYTPEDIAEDKPGQELRIAAAEGRVEDEGWRVRKDGSGFWANVIITAVRDPQGNLLGFSKITRDITERKQTQEALTKAKEEAERSNKFKDQFLSTMSHELRTPLNAVLGFSDLLTEERYGPLNDRQRRYVTHIHTGGKHLLRLINDILDLSKIEAGRLQLAIESVLIDGSFAEVIDTLRPLADKKSQALVVNTSPDLSVRADTTRFKQILMNLLGNAIKFTPEGGKIELTAQQLGEVVRVEVRDSGPGIPVEEQQRIFEAFHRLRQSEKGAEGTGLGLAITRRLVELHGGHLGLESQPGQGSCFYFTLPSVVAYATDEARDRSSGEMARESIRILVIEDDPAAAQLLQSHLASAGYDVVLCDHPQRALEMAAELQPSAVTLDILMKPVNGWEILPNLKSDPRTSKIPVIVVTVVDQPTTGALLGADEYVVKPVDKATLLAAVERCLNQRGRIGRARPILVVEDDTPTREFIAELLSKNGYLVGTAADGAEARAQVAAAVPELVILDLILPEVSGFQLLAEWRIESRTADLPIFVLTSKDLTLEERDYIRKNTGALFQKQERWQEALIRQLQRAVPPVLMEKS